MNIKLFSGSVVAGLLVLSAAMIASMSAVMCARAVWSYRSALHAREAGHLVVETAALDRVLLEAPPWVVPLRRAATHRLEKLALGDGPEAWYAALALVSSTENEARRRWQARCLEIVAASAPGPDTPMIPVDTTPPSVLASGTSVIFLLGWIGLAASSLMIGGPARKWTALAAAACWLVWIVALTLA